MLEERNDKLILKKVDSEVKKFSTLEKSFLKISQSEKDLYKSRVKAFKAIDNLKEENPHLNQSYVNFKNSLLELEQLRNSKYNKMDNIIIPALQYYPSKMKEFYNPVNKIKDLDKNLEKTKDQILKFKSKNDLDNASKLEQEKNKMRNQKTVVGNKMENELVEFEAERLEDFKYLLLHYVHSELSFHAQALEKMTKLFHEIHRDDPKQDLGSFVKKYNLTSLKLKPEKIESSKDDQDRDSKNRKIIEQVNNLDREDRAKENLNSENVKLSN